MGLERSFKNFTLLLFPLIFSISVVAKEMALVDFDKNDRKNWRIEKIDSFDPPSKAKSEKWAYRNRVVLKFVRTYLAPQTNQQVTWYADRSVWFKRSRDAKKFYTLLNSKLQFDLYYNFANGAFNSTGKQDICAAPVVGLFCRESSVTIVDFENIRGKDLFVFDKSVQKMSELSDYLDAHDEDLAEE